MVLFGFFGLLVLILHITDVKKIENYQKTTNRHQNTGIFIVQYFDNVQWCHSFGKPYVAVAISFVGLVLLAFGGRYLQGLFE